MNGTDSLWLFSEAGDKDFAAHMEKLHARLQVTGLSLHDYQELVRLSKTPGLDWLDISVELENLDLLSFTSICFALCERWFDVKMPLLRAYITEDFFETVTNTMRRDGVCGQVPMSGWQAIAN